ncbi:hypothetical protein ACFO1B_19950 [Dactylosporangium siamense]|uniref:Uncharacterized protein n=1 Tax=Dactylosporangium siamense TaxID=685454 RepID=A0A919PNB5_9ACTN|nr:hypothetical protein [Dactylosporangium siamense]GIG46999.1 hypothetical protein Dsi01nite_050400 [Dactylosporangium siamense]
MRTVLRLLGTRYGIAMALIVVVLVAVGFGRTIFTEGDQSDNDALGPTVAPATKTPDPFSSLGDDGVQDESASAAPSLSKGAADATAVATRFAKAWIRKPGVSGEQWRAGLKPDASSELMEDLADTDPSDVPAATITGPTALEDFGQVATAKIPADGGTIVLQLEAINGRWQVTSLDWEMA